MAEEDPLWKKRIFWRSAAGSIRTGIWPNWKRRYRQAGNLAGRVGAGVCCLVSALFVRAVHTVLLGPWVIYFSILGTHALVKFLKLKRKTDLVLTVLYLVMFLLFLVFFIRRLMEAAE